jgi:hypothetical protein
MLKDKTGADSRVVTELPKDQDLVVKIISKPKPRPIITIKVNQNLVDKLPNYYVPAATVVPLVDNTVSNIELEIEKKPIFQE